EMSRYGFEHNRFTINARRGTDAERSAQIPPLQGWFGCRCTVPGVAPPAIPFHPFGVWGAPAGVWGPEPFGPGCGGASRLGRGGGWGGGGGPRAVGAGGGGPPAVGAGWWGPQPFGPGCLAGSALSCRACQSFIAQGDHRVYARGADSRNRASHERYRRQRH